MLRLSFVSVLVSGQFCRVPELIPILQGLPSAVTLQRDVQHSVCLTSRRTTDTPVTLHCLINERCTPEQVTQNKWHKTTLLSVFVLLLHLLHLLLLSLPILLLVLLLLLFLIIKKFKLFRVFCLLFLIFSFFTDAARSEFRPNVSFVNSPGICLTDFYRMGQKHLTVFEIKNLMKEKL